MALSGFRRLILAGAILAAVLDVTRLSAQSVLGDPRDAPKVFATTCSACHKSPQGLAKSGQVAGFLRQHYTTGPEMSAAMAAYLVAAGSAPAAKKGQAEAKAGQAPGQAGDPKAKSRKQEQAGLTAAEHAAEAKDRRTLRGKQQAKGPDKSQEKPEERVAAHPSPASAAEAAAHPAAPAPNTAPA